MDEFDPDPTGVGVGDQTYSDLSSSSSEDIVLGSSALAARDSIALLHELCDKLIGSIQNTSSHINEANTEYLTIQGDTNYGYDPDARPYASCERSQYPAASLSEHYED